MCLRVSHKSLADMTGPTGKHRPAAERAERNTSLRERLTQMCFYGHLIDTYYLHFTPILWPQPSVSAHQTHRLIPTPRSAPSLPAPQGLRTSYRPRNREQQIPSQSSGLCSHVPSPSVRLLRAAQCSPCSAVVTGRQCAALRRPHCVHRVHAESPAVGRVVAGSGS